MHLKMNHDCVRGFRLRAKQAFNVTITTYEQSCFVDYKKYTRHYIPYPRFVFNMCNTYPDNSLKDNMYHSLKMLLHSHFAKYFFTISYAVITLQGGFPSGPEPKEINTLEKFCNRRICRSITTSKRPRTCFCCLKLSHCVAKCRAPSPLVAQGSSLIATTPSGLHYQKIWVLVVAERLTLII